MVGHTQNRTSSRFVDKMKKSSSPFSLLHSFEKQKFSNLHWECRRGINDERASKREKEKIDVIMEGGEFRLLNNQSYLCDSHQNQDYDINTGQ